MDLCGRVEAIHPRWPYCPAHIFETLLCLLVDAFEQFRGTEASGVRVSFHRHQRVSRVPLAVPAVELESLAADRSPIDSEAESDGVHARRSMVQFCTPVGCYRPRLADPGCTRRSTCPVQAGAGGATPGVYAVRVHCQSVADAPDGHPARDEPPPTLNRKIPPRRGRVNPCGVRRYAP
jgi:hypothetical protein